MTKTLIEQWREGKLPNGDYYIKVRGSLSKKDFYAKDNCINGKWAYTLDGNIIDIIEKVPSYDKYKELVQKIHILNEKNTKQYNELCEEIKKNNILEKKLEIATKALKKYQEAINRFKKDPMNKIIMLAHQLIYDIYIDSKKSLKEMEGLK